MKRSAKQSKLIVSEPVLVFTVLVMLFTLLSVKQAYAGVGGPAKINSALPGGVIFPVPVGILYPGFNTAAGVNAAALPGGKKITAVQVAAAPALATNDNNSYFASMATSNSAIGWGLGYTGASTSAGLTHGMFAGVGFNLKRINLGVGLRDSDLSGGFSPNVDIGSKFDLGKDFTFGAVAYNLDDTSNMQFAAGIGYGHPRKDNVEINLLTPAGGGSDYMVTFAATVYTGKFGTTFRTSYAMESQAFNHTLGLLYWLGSSMNVILQLTTPRTLTMGITVAF